MEMGFRWDRLRDSGEYLCPVCGFPGCFSRDAFGDTGGLVGSGRCPCCGYEPGLVDDECEALGYATLRECLIDFRNEWLKRRHWPEDGQMLWRGDVSLRPPGWSPERQLERLFALAPEMRGAAG
ncbi:MAG TPA: hypothetical protein VEA61_15865 [Allosphingosinicella sp.]|nr:hypothetical protein [Allosphingosinicella sp.]